MTSICNVISHCVHITNSKGFEMYALASVLFAVLCNSGGEQSWIPSDTCNGTNIEPTITALH